MPALRVVIARMCTVLTRFLYIPTLNVHRSYSIPIHSHTSQYVRSLHLQRDKSVFNLKAMAPALPALAAGG
jgi:hypothetical protein